VPRKLSVSGELDCPDAPYPFFIVIFIFSPLVGGGRTSRRLWCGGGWIDGVRPFRSVFSVWFLLSASASVVMSFGRWVSDSGAGARRRSGGFQFGRMNL